MSREEVVYRVRALLEAETNLRKQISDLEKKESVYSKTIQVFPVYFILRNIRISAEIVLFKTNYI